MVTGFVGQVHADQLFGWAFDSECPHAHLQVEVFCDGRHLGSMLADVYRVDLERAGIGDGDHGFVFRFAKPLQEAEMAAVTVRVGSGSDPAAGIALKRPGTAARVQPDPVSAPVDGQLARDSTQCPVFVMGAARSGTSALSQGLLASTQYVGQDEGQILDLLAPLTRTVECFYQLKADEVRRLERNTLIQRVPQRYVMDGIKAIFASAMREVFPGRRWIDKTPTVEMVRSIPLLLGIWPNARFIFMKRRALENLLSRERKFGAIDFEFHCREWADCMDAWEELRPALAGRALEIDQHELLRDGARVASAIAILLGLTANETAKLADVLVKHHPERTSTEPHAACDAETIPWTAQRWEIFDRVCGPALVRYGYSRDAGYYRSGADCPDRSCLAL